MPIQRIRSTRSKKVQKIPEVVNMSCQVNWYRMAGESKMPMPESHFYRIFVKHSKPKLWQQCVNLFFFSDFVWTMQKTKEDWESSS